MGVDRKENMMRYLTTAILSVLALALVQCNDGSSGIPPKTGSAGSGGTGNDTGTAGASGPGVGGTTGAAGTGDTSGTAGAAGSTSGLAGTTGEGGSTDTGGTTGAAGTTGEAGTTGSAGTTGAGGSAGSTATGRGGTSAAGTTGTGGTAGTTGTGGAAGMRTGPFKILMLTTTLEFKHDSIPTCLTMLQALGQANAPERAKIAGLPADTTWTVDQIANNPSAANYFSEVNADNLKKYELFYSNNPTGPVFTNAPSGAQKKQIFVDYWNNGGSWAGQHSATDFEKASGGTSWTWFHDNIDGSYFVDHDPDRTPGTINWQPNEINHPILKGLPTPWSTSDEWYVMNRNIEAVTGIRVLAKVTVTNSSKGTTPRPAVWVTENANGKGGRSFYTIKGHNQSVYSEPQFRELMLRGILWSVHRLPGGN
jgi:type 1 glutamine amidotransferase